MDSQTLMIGMFSIMGVMLIFIIVAFVLIQRKNSKSEKAALKKSLAAAGEKKRIIENGLLPKIISIIGDHSCYKKVFI